MKEQTCLFSLGLAAMALACAHASVPLYRDASQPLDARVHDLVARLTLDEKAGLMNNDTPGVPRLGVPRYNWWNEALHGVARAGNATVFPQAIGMAAMWDEPMMRRIGETIGIEARAKTDESIARGDEVAYHGLTFWSPNINIFRDPRWGRGQETYGEDPCLTAQLGVAFVSGLQGHDPRYLLAAGCAKHFAVHSGPEPLRHVFNVDPDPVDLHETYLPAFEALVRKGRVAGVMMAYNAVDGQPCTVNPLLFGLLRQWGFDGYVTSDCSGVADLFGARKFVAGAPEAEALAVKAGLCLTCGTQATALVEAVKRGLVSQREIDARLSTLLRILFRLGVFDPPAAVAYNAIPFSQNDSPAHAALALAAARNSIVLLKNDGLLPLRIQDLRRVAVIGPNAASVSALLGNYNGVPSAPVTILAGLKAALPASVGIDYVPGCAYLNPAAGQQPSKTDPNTAAPGGGESLAAAVQAARAADVTVFVGGYNAQIEGEEMPTKYEGIDRGDRTQIELPGPQEQLLEAVQACGKPVILVLMTGSAVAVPWADAHVAAILEAWYPGQAGGTALADILLGRTNPSGRLPVTFYSRTADLPPFTDYAMAGRTYRYFGGKPLYPFGFGLSYTSFRYQNARADVLPESDGSFAPAVRLSVQVTNAGPSAGDEVVQVYACEPAGRPHSPGEALCGFARVHLDPGQSASVHVPVDSFYLRRWDPGKNAYFVPHGVWTFKVGASSADLRASASAEIGRAARVAAGAPLLPGSGPSGGRG